MKKVFCLLIGLAMLTTSCKKNDENSNEIRNIDSKCVLLATIDVQNGVINYKFNLDELSYKLNTICSKREYNDFILESMIIIDTLPTSMTARPEMKISVINTIKEESFTIWLMEDFIHKVVKDQSVDYYLSEDVKKGNYTMGTWGREKTYIGIVENNNLTIKTIDSLCYAQQRVPRWTISCKPTNCALGCKKTELSEHYWRCSNCEPGQVDAKCEQGESWLLRFLMELVSIF